METKEMSILSDARDAMNENPAIARRAKFWAGKYVEDRTKARGAKISLIQEKLLQEFPSLGRKGAKFLAQHVTRDWQ